MIKVAILGATSHIARGLIFNFSGHDGYQLFLFARSPEKIKDSKWPVYPLTVFGSEQYDVVINCLGVRTGADSPLVFELTEKFDNIVLDHLAKYPEELYINFSSGAAYGVDFDQPVDESSLSRWEINKNTPAEYYGIAKLNAEVKHRSLQDKNIVDLRIFSYFSRFIDLQSRYFLTEIVGCLKEGRELKTDSSNIVRDYLHPQDLFSLIEKIIARRQINDVFDVYSLKPIKKRELLAYFTDTYGLKVVVSDSNNVTAPTGRKEHYYSLNKKAGRVLAYEPAYDSLGCIAAEIKYLLPPKK